MAGVGFSHIGDHMSDGIGELALHCHGHVVFHRVEREVVAVSESMQLEHLLRDREEWHELVKQTVGNDERKPGSSVVMPEPRSCQGTSTENCEMSPLVNAVACARSEKKLW